MGDGSRLAWIALTHTRALDPSSCPRLVRIDPHTKSQQWTRTSRATSAASAARARAQSPVPPRAPRARACLKQLSDSAVALIAVASTSMATAARSLSAISSHDRRGTLASSSCSQVLRAQSRCCQPECSHVLGIAAARQCSVCDLSEFAHGGTTMPTRSFLAYFGVRHSFTRSFTCVCLSLCAVALCSPLSYPHTWTLCCDTCSSAPPRDARSERPH